MPIEWITDDGCDRCDGLAGEYETESDLPDRPHDFCDCEILADTGSMVGNEWEIIYEGYEWENSELWYENGERHWNGELTLEGQVKVICWNGDEHEADVRLTIPLEFSGEKTEYDEDEVDWDEQWHDKAMEKMEELIEECPGFPQV